MKQEVSFGLMDLIRAVEEAKEVIAQSDLDSSARDDFSIWWDRRKRAIIRELEDKLARADGATSLWLGLGIYVLDPERATAQSVLKNELPGHIEHRLKSRVRTFEGNINGHGYSPSKSWRVLTEQIAEIWEVRDEVRELGILIGQTLSGNHTHLPKDVNLPGHMSELSDMGQELDGLLDKLGRLDRVVRNVCSQLPTAYRRNRKEQWDSIYQWLKGLENVDENTPWVPKGLSAHRTLNWVENLHTALKEHRNKLQESVDKIIWCLRWEELERVKPAEAQTYMPDQPNPNNEDGRQWAQEWIATSWSEAKNPTGSPLGVESMLEYAEQRARELRARAEPPNYRYEYYDDEQQQWNERDPVEGTYRFLTKQICTPLYLPEELDKYLEERTQEIKNLRKELLTYLGGRLSDGSSESPPYHPWKHTCETVTKHFRKGEFGKAHEKCKEIREEITTKTKSLKAVITSRREAGVKAAMSHMLLEQAESYKAHLEQELKCVNDIHAQIDPLEERFTRCWVNFNWQLSQLKQGCFSRLRLAIGRRGWQEDLKAEVLASFRDAQRICPEHPEVLGWQEKLGEKAGPDTNTWQEQHLEGCRCKEKQDT